MLGRIELQASGELGKRIAIGRTCRPAFQNGLSFARSLIANVGSKHLEGAYADPMRAKNRWGDAVYQELGFNEVGDLLHHLHRVGNAAGPERVSDGVDLAA